MASTKSKSTLGLDDDMDGVDMIVDIEKSFDVAFRDDETIEWYTVGDIYSAVKNRFSTKANGYLNCATQKAFYRLRRCLGSDVDVRYVTPDTLLADLKNCSTKEVYRKLAREHGLRSPAPIIGWMGILALIMIVMAIVAGFVMHSSSLKAAVIVVLLLTGVTTWHLANVHFPSGCKTVGDLAKRIAACNFVALKGKDARVRHKELWDTLVNLLADHSDLHPCDIRPETLLLAKQAK